MKKRIARYRADTLAQLQTAILDAFAGIANKRRPEEILSTFGPMALDLIETTFSDKSTVINFQMVAMTSEELRRERE